MVEPVDIPKSVEDHLNRIGSCEVIVAVLPGVEDAKLLPWIPVLRQALASFSKPVRVAVVRMEPKNGNVGASSAPENHIAQEPEETGQPDVLVFPYPNIDPGALANPVQQLSEVYRATFAIGEELGARAYGVFASDLAAVDARWICQFLYPVVEKDYDLVAPCYARPRFDALLNTAIFSPLVRALYGKRMQTPVGPDLVVSSRFAAALTSSVTARSRPSEKVILGSTVLVPAAIRGGFEVCQASVGTRIPVLGDSVDLSSLLSEILGATFLDMEMSAAYWQKIRGSDPAPSFGNPPAAVSDGDAQAPDAQHMMESFQLGWRSLREVWSVALPPSALLELGRLARMPAEQFRMPDELWARIVYDFALAHRVGEMNRDHLLRSMTPLYLAWAASYVLEMSTAAPEDVEPRRERLACAFESEKRYLLSRWRWPDRFNP